ncbi:MAG: YceI family protein [Leptospira sp.]|nr:YceI family protein [Leptospira sp.]
MKQILSFLTISLILGLSACKETPANKTGDVYPVASGSGDSHSLDTTKSIIRWKGSKVTGSHNGTVNIKSGNLSAKGGKITSGNFVIDMPTIVNEDLEGEWKAKLEGHLKDTDFFEVGKFPEGKFEIASVTPSENGYDVRGNLTLKGISKGIEFPATIKFDGDKPVSAKATVRINRQLWDIVYKGQPDDLIKDTIELDLDLVTK